MFHCIVYLLHLKIPGLEQSGRRTAGPMCAKSFDQNRAQSAGVEHFDSPIL